MEDRRGLYAFAGILLGFKIWTLILILWLTSSWQAVIFILAGHIVWVGIGALFIAGPTAFWMRLVRARAKRKRLQHAEWHIEEAHESLHHESASDD